MSNEGNQQYNWQGKDRRPFHRKRGNQKNNNTNQKTTAKGKTQISKDLKFKLHGTGKEKQSCSYAKVLEKICLRLQQNLTNRGSNKEYKRKQNVQARSAN